MNPKATEQIATWLDAMGDTATPIWVLALANGDLPYEPTYREYAAIAAANASAEVSA